MSELFLIASVVFSFGAAYFAVSTVFNVVDVIRSKNDSKEESFSFIDELDKMGEPAKGKKLDRLSAHLGVDRNRRFLYREGDKSLRRRTLESMNRHTGTLADIKASAEGQCIGLIKAAVTDSRGEVFVKLDHRWWAWPWTRGNKRRVTNYLRLRCVAAGVRLEVL